jgi:hypothetical protein
MRKKIEKTWWIDLPCYACAILIVRALLHAAGVEHFTPGAGFSPAGFVVWACCFHVVERIVRFVLWAAVLAVAPDRAAEMR